jgi:hypothetical protein
MCLVGGWLMALSIPTACTGPLPISHATARRQPAGSGESVVNVVPDVVDDRGVSREG